MANWLTKSCGMGHAAYHAAQDEDNPSRTTLRSTIDSWLKDFFAMATVMVRHCLLMSPGDE